MATQKQYLEVSNRWKKRLGLDGLEEITISFEDGIIMPDGRNMQASATTSSDPEYLTHFITINKNWLKDASVEDLEDTALHELFHVLTSGLWSWGLRVIEQFDEDAQPGYLAWMRREHEEMTSRLTKLYRKANWF